MFYSYFSVTVGVLFLLLVNSKAAKTIRSIGNLIQLTQGLKIVGIALAINPNKTPIIKNRMKPNNLYPTFVNPFIPKQQNATTQN